jgi:prevent-host-death family protein
MEISAKQLRTQPGRILSQVNRGQQVIITYRGKACAKIVPLFETHKPDLSEPNDELFGIWKDRAEMENVDEYVRNMRKGRDFGD